MSFEGFYQLLCASGHYTTVDCYAHNGNNICHCGKPIVWHSLVDETNEPMVGYVKLKLLSNTFCDKCGHVLEETYDIPLKGRKK